jgi:hypothetical protein
VNRDGAIDVVIEQRWTHKRISVWLGDGHGGFQEVCVEDFPSRDTATGDRVDSPPTGPDCTAVCLSTERSTETAKLTAQLLAGRPPTPSELAAFSPDLSPRSPALSRNLSRAPPRLSSL